jgi:putative phosphoesterase
MTGVQSQTLPRLSNDPPSRTVGLISDTHVPSRARQIPKEVFAIFNRVDYVVHAGDLVTLSVIDELEQVAPVLAVYGNMDGPDVREKLQKLDSFRIFDWKIGVTHDPGTLFGTGKMRGIAAKHAFNVLVYGHSHSSSIRWEGGMLFINPGSPTNPVPPFIGKPTVALLKITKQEIIPRIIQVQTR